MNKRKLWVVTAKAFRLSRASVVKEPLRPEESEKEIQTEDSIAERFEKPVEKRQQRKR